MDIIAVIAVLCAYLVKGMSGFANTLIFSTIMGFTRNNINISPVELIVGFLANIIIFIKERRHIKARIWLPLSALVIVGTIPGALILKLWDVRFIKLIFGFAVLFLAVEMYIRGRSRKQMKGSRVMLTLIGLFSGILSGLFGIGALLAAYVGRTTENNSEFKANICAVFFAENVFRLLLYSFTGIITADVLSQAMWLVPFMFIGLVCGMVLSKRVSDRILRSIVTLLLMLSGVSLIVLNLPLGLP